MHRRSAGLPAQLGLSSIPGIHAGSWACMQQWAAPFEELSGQHAKTLSVGADGVGIAWAASEHLIALGAATLFATHFSALGKLAGLYPNAKLWRFGVDATGGSAGLRYEHKLLPGSQAPQHYGLLLAPAVRAASFTQ